VETRDKLTGRQGSERVLYTDGPAPKPEPACDPKGKPEIDWDESWKKSVSAKGI
jgi:hypothetical protein